MRGYFERYNRNEKRGRKRVGLDDGENFRQKSGVSKLTLSYWTSHVVKQRKNGKESLCYYLRVKSRGKTYWITTDQSSREDAGVKALEIYKYIQSDGIEVAYDRYQRKTTVSRDIADLSVGDLMNGYERSKLLKHATFVSYRRKFYLLVSEIKRIPSKGNHTVDGSKAFREKV